LLAAMAVVGYGFLQRLGSTLVFDSGTARISGTIANPGFLAAYLLFHLTFALTIITDKVLNQVWRYLAAISLVWLALGFLLTGIRGAFLGLLVGAVVFALGYLLWMQKSKVKYWTLLIIAIFFIAVGFLFVFRHTEAVFRNKLIGKYFNISLADSTVQTRLISWRGALNGLPDHLWLGVGPQKFDVVFNKYFDPRFYNLVGNETWWDRAHNMALEVLTTMGILGLLSYLAVGLALFWALFQLGRRCQEQRTEVLLLSSFLAAYFIQNLFVFDSISTYLTMSFLVGYIITITYSHGQILENIKEIIAKGRSKNQIIVVLVLSIMAVAPIAYAYNIKFIKHNLLFLQTLAQAENRPFASTINSYRRVLELSDFDQREVIIKLGQYLGQRALSGRLTIDDLRSGYNFFLAKADKAIKANPQDVRLLLSYGNSVNVYGEMMKTKDVNLAGSILQKAESALLEAASLGRSRQQVFYSLANTYLIAGETKKGIDILEEAARLHEDTPTAYWLLAFAYQQAKENDKAIAAADKALDKNYVFQDEKEANPIAGLYLETKDYERLLRLYKRVAKDIPTGTAQARLAALYAQMGRKEEALSAAAEVTRRDPSLKPQVDDFIKKVKSGARVDFLTGE